MRKAAMLAAMGLVCACSTPGLAASEARADEGGEAGAGLPGEAARLAALGELYGLVRFFHPSDEAQEIDWARFMVHATREMRGAATGGAAAETLLELFGPITRGVVVSTDPIEPDDVAMADPALGVSWQHYGLGYGPGSNMYRSQRVGPGHEGRLFEGVEPASATVTVELGGAEGSGVFARVPIVLGAVGGGAENEAADAAVFEALASVVGETVLPDVPGEDADVRIASTLMAWATLSHFFPYFSDVDVEWDAEIVPAIEAAMADQSADEFFYTMCRLIAKLRDGHGYSFYRFADPAYAPEARFDVVTAADGTEVLIVTRAWGDCALERGDIVERVGERSAAEELAWWEAVTSGSDQLRRHRALNQIGAGSRSEDVTFVVRRAADGGEDERVTVRAARAEWASQFFRKPEYVYPAVSEIEDGVWLVNIEQITKEAWDANLGALAHADAVIYDSRWGGSGDQEINSLRIASHYIDAPAVSPTWRVPRITMPSFEHVDWETSAWPIEPAQPAFAGKAAILTAPPIVSFGETIMSFWRHYDLAVTVGEPTAGCNGNVNRIDDLPCGITVSWTGIDVKKHDGRTLYGVGYVPDHPVKRTVAQIRSGEDVALAKAVEVLQRVVAGER
ncbi:MAG: hypothetical protein AAF235_09545 [Planctomycetota bacterium]